MNKITIHRPVGLQKQATEFHQSLKNQGKHYDIVSEEKIRNYNELFGELLKTPVYSKTISEMRLAVETLRKSHTGSVINIVMGAEYPFKSWVDTLIHVAFPPDERLVYRGSNPSMGGYNIDLGSEANKTKTSQIVQNLLEGEIYVPRSEELRDWLIALKDEFSNGLGDQALNSLENMFEQMMPVAEQLPAEGGDVRQKISFVTDDKSVQKIIETLKRMSIPQDFAQQILAGYTVENGKAVQETPNEKIANDIATIIRNDPETSDFLDAYSMVDVLGPNPLDWDLKNLNVPELFQKFSAPDFFDKKEMTLPSVTVSLDDGNSLTVTPFKLKDVIQPVPLNWDDKLMPIVRRFQKATGNYRIALFAQLLALIERREKTINRKQSELDKLGRNAKGYNEKQTQLIRDYDNLNLLKHLIPRGLTESGIARQRGFTSHTPYRTYETSLALAKLNRPKNSQKNPAAPGDVRGIEFVMDLDKIYKQRLEEWKSGKLTGGVPAKEAQAELATRKSMLADLNNSVIKPLNLIVESLSSNGVPASTNTKTGKALIKAKALLAKLAQGSVTTTQKDQAASDRFNLIFGNVIQGKDGVGLSNHSNLAKEVVDVYKELRDVVENRNNDILDERLLILWNLDKSQDPRTIDMTSSQNPSESNGMRKIPADSAFNKLFSPGSADKRGGRITVLVTQDPIVLGNQQIPIKYIVLDDENHCVDDAAAEVLIRHARKDAREIIERRTGKQSTPDQELVALSKFDVQAIANLLVGKPLVLALEIVHPAFTQEIKQVIDATKARTDDPEEQKMFKENERINGASLVKLVEDIGNAQASRILAGVGGKTEDQQDLLTVSDPEHDMAAIIRAKRDEDGSPSTFATAVEGWIESSKSWKDCVESMRLLSLELEDPKLGDQKRAQVVEELGRLRKEYEGYIGSIPHLMILWGGGGTGKTMMADGLAHLLGFKVVKANISACKTMWLGETERKLRVLWRTLMSMSNIVVLLDEIDSAIGNTSNTADQSDASRANTGFLLQVLDSSETTENLKSRNIFIIGTTNNKQDIRRQLINRAAIYHVPHADDVSDITDYYTNIVERMITKFPPPPYFDPKDEFTAQAFPGIAQLPVLPDAKRDAWDKAMFVVKSVFGPNWDKLLGECNYGNEINWRKRNQIFSSMIIGIHQWVDNKSRLYLLNKAKASNDPVALRALKLKAPSAVLPTGQVNPNYKPPLVVGFPPKKDVLLFAMRQYRGTNERQEVAEDGLSVLQRLRVQRHARGQDPDMVEEDIDVKNNNEDVLMQSWQQHMDEESAANKFEGQGQPPAQPKNLGGGMVQPDPQQLDFDATTDAFTNVKPPAAGTVQTKPVPAAPAAPAQGNKTKTDTKLNDKNAASDHYLQALQRAGLVREGRMQKAPRRQWEQYEDVEYFGEIGQLVLLNPFTMTREVKQDIPQ